MTSWNDDRVKALTEAYEAGTAAAMATSVGTVFRGAKAEALKAGYDHGMSEYSVFVDGYLFALPRPITLDRYNVITSIGECPS